jgi:Protein of unknown function (DUF1570)
MRILVRCSSVRPPVIYRRIRRWSQVRSAGVTILVTAVVVHAVRAADDQDSTSADVSILRSHQFALASDVDQHVSKEILADLDATYGDVVRFLATNAAPMKDRRRRLEASCFADRAEFERCAAYVAPGLSGTDGFYDPKSKRSYFFIRTNAGGDRERIRLFDQARRTVVRHETVHQVIDALRPLLGQRMPTWFSEGLACSFEVVGGDCCDGHASFNRWRAADLPASRAGSIVFALVSDHWSSDARGGVMSAESYAASWAVVSYLRCEKPDALKRYLRALVSDVGQMSTTRQIEMFESAFGPIGDPLGESVTAFVQRSRAAAASCAKRDDSTAE